MTESHRPLAGVIAIAITIGNLFLHKPISDVCDALFAAVGRSWYERISIAAIGGASLLAALPGARRRLRELSTLPVLSALLGTALLTAMAQRWLLVSNVELVHLPQFALIAALLVAAGFDPLSAWLGATTAGLIDETYQHLVIYQGVAGTYFDFNDIVLDALGATWGVLLTAPTGRRGATPPRAALVATGAALLCAAAAAAFFYAPPRFSPLLVGAATGRHYRVLSPGEGLRGGLAAAGLVVAARRRPRSPAAVTG